MIKDWLPTKARPLHPGYYPMRCDGLEWQPVQFYKCGDGVLRMVCGDGLDDWTAVNDMHESCEFGPQIWFPSEKEAQQGDQEKMKL